MQEGQDPEPSLRFPGSNLRQAGIRLYRPCRRQPHLWRSDSCLRALSLRLPSRLRLARASIPVPARLFLPCIRLHPASHSQCIQPQAEITCSHSPTSPAPVQIPVPSPGTPFSTRHSPTQHSPPRSIHRSGNPSRSPQPVRLIAAEFATPKSSLLTPRIVLKNDAQIPIPQPRKENRQSPSARKVLCLFCVKIILSGII